MSFHYGEKTKLVPFSNICSDLNYYHKTKRTYQLDFNFVTWQQKNGKIINLNLVSWVSSTFIISHSLLDFSSPFVLLGFIVMLLFWQFGQNTKWITFLKANWSQNIMINLFLQNMYVKFNFFPRFIIFHCFKIIMKENHSAEAKL